jgi:hypothetical protein
VKRCLVLPEPKTRRLHVQRARSNPLAEVARRTPEFRRSTPSVRGAAANNFTPRQAVDEYRDRN